VLGAQHPLTDGQQRRELVPGPGRIPASPVKAARLFRAVRMDGCSGPSTRSIMGSSAANWSRAPAASPAAPVKVARLARAVRVSGCSGACVLLQGRRSGGTPGRCELADRP
jgi:hypothetical protein